MTAFVCLFHAVVLPCVRSRTVHRSRIIVFIVDGFVGLSVSEIIRKSSSIEIVYGSIYDKEDSPNTRELKVEGL